MTPFVEQFMALVKAKNQAQPEFIQAVEEVVESLEVVLDKHPEYRSAKILERIVEPERVMMFRVPWMNDQGEVQINRGFRVEMNSAIGPYKGGLRFHPSVNLSILKFLAFEQVFKNSLTTLPMGGGKGGSDFDPKGKTDNEVMRFCQSFMSELFRHIGPNTDVPAGDIGVGGREIGFLFGQYKKLRNEFTGILTGKGINWGGSLIRPEATGYGVAYFLKEMLATKNLQLDGKTICISGYGNVGVYFIEKANNFGAKIVTIGDEYGYVHDPDGISGEKLDFLRDLWTVHRKSAEEYAKKFNKKWIPKGRPWEVKCDIAVPTATENEIDESDAKKLVENGCIAVCEAANMPTVPNGVKLFIENGILFAPGKAANAGGVAVSGLEMSQNSMRYGWTREEVDNKLQQIMKNIHNSCVEASERFGTQGNYVNGANIAGFIKVADAMMDQGIV
ncbi:MAG: NADP-specific glutamate dehydrogenase [Candidatus Zixiibacteriota bacterium]|nr:MAG: NADP-specific glutamate dehydrogenase [candidate division Zixibacteria bacterium]